MSGGLISGGVTGITGGLLATGVRVGARVSTFGPIPGGGDGATDRRSAGTLRSLAGPGEPEEGTPQYSKGA